MTTENDCTDADGEKPAVAQQQLVRLRELAAQLPTDLVSDWEDTNHFELTSRPAVRDPNHEYWWLCLGDYFRGFPGLPCETTEGKRIGLMMDIVAEVARLRDVGAI